MMTTLIGSLAHVGLFFFATTSSSKWLEHPRKGDLSAGWVAPSQWPADRRNPFASLDQPIL